MIENPIKANARALRVHNMLKRGASRNQIAKMLGTNKQYVSQLEKRGRRIQADITTRNPAIELSERIRNAFNMVGCDPSAPANVKVRFPGGLNELRLVPNIGAKSIREINAWLIKHGQEPLT